LAVSSGAFALACLAALVVVASLQHADTLSTVALALAVITFVAQLIVFVVQAGASNEQIRQSRELHAEQLELLTELRERARGTDATVARIDERLLEAALNKTLPDPGHARTSQSDVREIASGVADILNTSAFEREAVQAGTTAESTSPRPTRERFERIPPVPTINKAVATLETLSPEALRELVKWRDDEIEYADGPVPPGLTMWPGGRQELYSAGLVKPDDVGRLYLLTDDGRDAASVLTSEDDLPSQFTDAVHQLREAAKTDVIA
jgi:hypothetical protein